MAPFSSISNNISIYTVNGPLKPGQNQPDWLGSTITRAHKQRARNSKKKLSLNSHNEGKSLIQDFDFPEASIKIKSSPDALFLIATGTYKPRIKVFDLAELSLKFDRVTDSENVDFCILSSDWTKTLHLQSDRTLDLHTQTASYYRIRIPKHGRALSYHFPSCDAICGGAGSELWRLNLDQGRFMAPFQLAEDVAGVNALDINPVHGLIAVGTDSHQGLGTVEFWDHRARARAAILRLPYPRLCRSPNEPVCVTALASRLDGLTLAVGTSTGHSLLYDLRSPVPHTFKDQGYGLPIRKIEFPTALAASGFGQTDGLVATVDAKVLKIWDRHSAENLVSVNPSAPVNDMHIFPDSGLVLLANEASPMTGYFIPALGPAPRWARFLENITEEMEQTSEPAVYDDYKFVSDTELRTLSLDHLIGSPALRPYMHGYFVDLRLYAKAKAIANPFGYIEYRDKLVREKIAKEQESRIRTSKTRTTATASGAEKLLLGGIKTNKALAQRILNDSTQLPANSTERTDSQKLKKATKDKSNLPSRSILDDKRFKDLFTNEEFEIDEYSHEFAALNPSASSRSVGQNEQKVQMEQLDSEESEEEEDRDESEEEGVRDENTSSDSSSDDDIWKKKKIQPVRQRQASSEKLVAREKPRMLVNVDGQNVGQLEQRQTFGQLLGQRPRTNGKETVVEVESDTVRELSGGGMEVSFTPTCSKSKISEKQSSSRSLRKKSNGETFGIGLSKGAGIGLINGGEFLEENNGGGGEGFTGRIKKRKIERSASRTKIRKL